MPFSNPLVAKLVFAAQAVDELHAKGWHTGPLMELRMAELHEALVAIRGPASYQPALEPQPKPFIPPEPANQDKEPNDQGTV